MNAPAIAHTYNCEHRNVTQMLRNKQTNKQLFYT